MLELETKLTRRGQYSAYGRFVAIMDVAGEKTTIAQIDNVSLHVDAQSRKLALGLGKSALPAGTLSLSYIGGAEFEGRVFATKTFEIAAPE